ncbi:hypothetical protein B0H19DRAFT_1257476 [Mycena capillaripes]|nr:hypothetical protein B0H19DRAFT_1257476 [Mycena capillaripes]
MRRIIHPPLFLASQPLEAEFLSVRIRSLHISSFKVHDNYLAFTPSTKKKATEPVCVNEEGSVAPNRPFDSGPSQPSLEVILFYFKLFSSKASKFWSSTVLRTVAPVDKTNIAAPPTELACFFPSPLQAVMGTTTSPHGSSTSSPVYGSAFTRVHHLAPRPDSDPASVAQDIARLCGSGAQRYDYLKQLRRLPTPEMRQHCSRLLKYTLRTEPATTQTTAFKSITALVTRFPGLRRVFCDSDNFPTNLTRREKIAAWWDRVDNNATSEWDFHRQLAAACVSDQDIAPMIETCPVHILTSTRTDDDGLCLIEQLLVRLISIRSQPHELPRAICIRYLGGVLELPRFWDASGGPSDNVIKKLCLALILILKDVGADPAHGADAAMTERLWDSEGVELLICAVLSGIFTRTSTPESEDVGTQNWCDAFRYIVQIMRQ